MGLNMTRLLKNLELSVGIGEASRVSGATLTQIRYWEKKGLLTSFQHSDGRNKRFTLQNVIAMSTIKQLLDEGYTLAKAAEIIVIRKNTADRLHVIGRNLKDVHIDDDGTSYFNFGQLENDPDYDVVAEVRDNEYRLVKTKNK